MGVFCCFLVVLSTAGAAWACTSQPRLLAVSPIRERPGEAVTITGEGVPAPVVAIRWNTLNGPKLAEVTPQAGSFSTSIVVPDVAPGVYFVLVETTAGVARAAFEVAAGPGNRSAVSSLSGQGVETGLWQGFGRNASGTGLADNAPSPRSGSNAPLAAGIALLGAGLVAMTGLGGVAYRGRRRRRSA